jgi:hypothetical protein
VAELDAQSGESPSGARAPGVRKGLGYGGAAGDGGPELHASTGGAARFFNTFHYYAKAPGGERHAGCDDLFWAVDKRSPFWFRRVSRAAWEGLPETERGQGNVHPTVKRLALMMWLHKLAAGVGPIGDLCAGSGSGAIAAWLEGIEWVGAELQPEALEIARARLAWWQGLSPTAVAAFRRAGEMPEAAPPPRPGQLSLLGDPEVARG